METRIPKRAAEYRLQAFMALDKNWIRASAYFLILSLMSLGLSLFIAYINPALGISSEEKDLSQALSEVPRWAWALSITLSAAFNIASPVITVGGYAMLIRVLSGERASPRRGVECFGFIFKAFGAAFVRAILIVLSFLLFLISGIGILGLPLLFFGIMLLYMYSMIEYLLARHPDMGAIEALRQSRQLMRGRKARLFCLQFSFFGWALLHGLLCDSIITIIKRLFELSDYVLRIIDSVVRLAPTALLITYATCANAAFFVDAESAGPLY